MSVSCLLKGPAWLYFWAQVRVADESTCLLRPAHPYRQPAQVEALLGGEEGITFESIHGGDTSLIRAADLDLDRFIPRGSGAAASIPAAELPAAPTAVLLTGANGFLGRFLLLELLQRVARQCAHVLTFHVSVLP